MSQLKSERLDIVKRLAQQKEEMAAKKLRDQRQRLDMETRQLQQLQDYYVDYLERIEKQKLASVSDVVTYREFSHRLAAAVKQQQTKIKSCEANLDAINKQWSLLRQKRLAIDEVIEQSRYQEQGERDRLEQKLLDEIGGSRQPNFPHGLRS